MCDSGYLSGTGIKISPLKSPQGRQSSGSLFDTKCKGDVALEFDGRQIPTFTKKSNSLVAILYKRYNSSLKILNLSIFLICK